VCIDTSSEQPQLFDDLPLESSSPIASLLTEPSYESISSSDAKKVTRTNSNSIASPLKALVVERALEVSKGFMYCRCFSGESNFHFNLSSLPAQARVCHISAAQQLKLTFF
jgi:hypothetical protein